MKPPDRTMTDTAPHIPFVASGSYPVRYGNRVRPLVDGIPAFRRIGEAVEAARHSVWVTVTFFADDFQMPEERGSFFDLLDRAAARGLDVRVIFWRPNPESSGYGRTFTGTVEDRAKLRARGSRFRVRWDRAPAAFCQHQKSWLVDAGQPTESAFVGGMNLTGFALATPGHPEDARHDLYVELAGPAATDVHHNFAQRWNEASERMREDGLWGHAGEDALPFPRRLSGAQGETPVQVQRNLHAGLYRDGHPTPGGGAHDIAAGERTIFEQYCQAIDAARRTIYIENQAVPTPAIATRIEAALQRGVEVVALVPADPERHVREGRRDPGWNEFFAQLTSLGRHGNFALAGIAVPDARGGRRNIYVHGKAMLIDDAWATIGSCNLHWYSMNGNSEMNASFWDPGVVKALRCQLLAEHLDRDTAHLDDRAALRLYREVAEDNRRKRDSGDADWQGLAFSLDPARYGE
jgi:phosphatidylserine/phosphatidylglycerophosphate/cardiolipin synthase-like enzyme